MNVIKAVFGVLMLAVALWLLERVLPTAVTMLLAGMLLIVSGIYMGAFDGLAAGVSGWRRLWKGLGLVVVIYGGVMLLGAAGGGNDLMQPLKGMTLAGGGAGGGAQPQLVFRYVKGPEGLSAALTEARAQGRPAMLDFYADWCISCKEMEKYTFSDPAVQAALSNAVLLKTDVTANDAQDQALLKQFRLIGPPAILFFTAGGEELSRSRVVGYMKAEPFAAHVRAAVGG
jgi:thiol:disulfide interchange protein DsbD